MFFTFSVQHCHSVSSSSSIYQCEARCGIGLRARSIACRTSAVRISFLTADQLYFANESTHSICILHIAFDFCCDHLTRVEMSKPAAAKSRPKQPASSRQAQEYLQQAAALSSSNAFATNAFAAFGLPFTTDTEATTSASTSLPSSSASASAMPSVAPAAARLRDSVDTSDSTLNFILRKLTKRDTTTKLKAVDELTVHLTAVEPATIPGLMPALLYALDRLYSDNDRRVRETLQAVLAVLVERAKREAFTPANLRQLFPLWWCWQHDSVKEVSRRSRAVWKTLLPTDDKERQALRFVHPAYFSHTTSLLTSTAESLSDMAVTSVEAAQERYDRLVAASITGLLSWMQRLTADDNIQYQSEYDRLLDTALPLLQSPRPLVRRAMYALLTGLVSLQRDWMARQLQHLSPLLLDVVGERDKTNHAAMWDVLLHFLQSFPSCFEHLPPEPQRYRQLLLAIENAGYGSSVLLWSHLLPLLSTIPTSATSPAFYHSFFTALFASRLSLDQPSAVVSSSARDLTPLFSAYLECALYVIVRNRRDAPNKASAVLYDELLDVLWRELSEAEEEDGRERLWQQAGKSLAVIERHLQRDADEGKEQGSGLTVEALYFRLQELCKMGLERAEREDIHAAESAAGDGSAVRRKKSVWKRVEELVCAMQQERIAQRAKAAADKSSPSSSSSSAPPPSFADPLAALASTLFLFTLRSFARTLSLSPIHLAQSFASAFSITALLASSTPPTSPSTFLTTNLLPIFRTLLSQPSDRTDDQTITVDSYLALLGETLRVCDYGEVELSEAQKTELDELMGALIALSPIQDGSSVTVSTLSLSRYLTFFQSFLSHVLTRLPHFTAHPTLDDVALSLAEQVLTSESSTSSTQLVTCMTLLVPLLSSTAAHGVLSSFVEALSGFLAQSSPFAPREVDAQQFTAATGATVASLPSLLHILAPYINSPPPSLSPSSSSSSASDQSVEWQQLHVMLLSALFFLQFSIDSHVASTSKQLWQSVPASTLQEPSPVLSSIAATVHDSLMTDQLSSLTSAFILGWSHQAAALTSAFPTLLSSFLPSHTELTRVMRDSSEEEQERVRVIRDCVSELMHELGQSAVLSNREWLLVDLLAIELHFRWRTRTSKHVEADTLLDSLTAFVLSQSEVRSLPNLFQQAFAASAQLGAPYSDSLRLLVQLADKHELQLEVDLPQLLVRSLLLPLAGQGESSKLPSAFSSLLAPLAASMPKSLDRKLRQTLTAMLSSSAAYAPLSSSTAPAADSLVPHLDVLARAAANEIERVSKRGGKDEADLAYAASLLAILAAIIHHAPVVPAWLKQRAFGLLSSLPAPPSSPTQSSIEYTQGRAELCDAVWLRLEGKLSALPAVMIKSLVAIAANNLQYALIQSRLRVDQPATSFAYLQPTVAFLHSALPSLVSSASSLSLDLLPVIRSCYQLLASPLVSTVLSVTHYEETLTQLAGSVVHYLQHVTDALNLLLASDFADFSHTFALSPSSPPPFSATAPLSHFFGLLSHPFPALALEVHQLLSIGLLYRAVSCVVDEEEEESLAVVKKSLSDDEGDDDEHEEKASRNGETDEEQDRKEARRRRRRIVRERQRLRERISLVLPPQLQALLEGHLQTDDAVSTTTSSTSAAAPYLFAGRPLALQLRGHLLVLSLVLNLHNHVLPLSSSSLSSGKRTLLLSYLRDFDGVSPFLSELIEHIAVAATPQHITATLAQASGPLIIPLAVPMLVAAPAVNDEQRLQSSWRRSHQLAQLHAVLSYVDETVFYPALSCVLYLRVLHVLPALARAWWTNVDRQSSATVQRITTAHFSPLLIAHELSAVSSMSPPKPTDPGSESELTLSAILSTSTVSARYVKDELQLTLLLRLSPVHPLTPPTVELTSDSLRIAPQLLKRWQLQVTSSLLSSSRSIGAAVEGWYVNVDGHLSGVEEVHNMHTTHRLLTSLPSQPLYCIDSGSLPLTPHFSPSRVLACAVSQCPICYSVVHGVHGVLPRMRCAQCGKRYHNVCLYTWFEKSGHSSCPLCRGSF